ncbi:MULTISPECIES: hypothetical protein [unclassified Variovorax]|uniref:hypothetical protein n=1 Tax=unclassified Variovorax TaxID=663243 RepID=UPI0013175129|nr:MULTISPECIES: hypothetical protein [unclassified Variovorax]VTU41696.1 hypothetical protein H6P1_00028 [Variovorax sp. PBL-H6]VTU44602.1 hypothetical protein SRS16P1_00874 [Variovorax sp. SRS16]VTU44649.1 hypothetical protein E5P1_00866 [Variovorax sp. PBL-E5]
MSHVNTAVVRALMSLRGISTETLCTLAHVSSEDMHNWLYDQGGESGEQVEFETQLEILRFLGIHGESPRADVVHYWRIEEPFFSRAEKTYQPLGVMLRAFGKAQVAYLARESDPALTFQAKSCFALKFANFQAILEVSVHPLRSVSFDPDSMTDVEWVPDTMGVLLPDAQYDRLQPGAMKVRNLTQYITYTSEMAQWERLREVANARGILAEQVANALVVTSGVPLPALTEATSARQSTAAVPAAHVAPAPVAAAAPPIQAPAAVVPPPPAPSPVAVPSEPLQPEELKLFVRPALVGGEKRNLRAVN